MLESEPLVYHFGEFDLDAGAWELRRAGRRVRLERRPMDLLVLLVARRGQLVPRAEIVTALWGDDVFVDVETGINTAIRKVRQALADPADAPRFVETVPGRGYRFVAEVTVSSRPGVPSAAEPPPEHPAPEPAPLAGPPDAAVVSGRRRGHLRLALPVVVLLAGLALWFAWTPHTSPVTSRTVAVLPFDNLSGETEHGFLADGLADETISSLGRLDPEHILVVARTSTLAYRGTTKSVAEIGRELQADYLVESSIRSAAGRFVVTLRLVRVRDQVQVWSGSYGPEPASLLRMQRDLSAAIAAETGLRPSADRLDALAALHRDDAFTLYLRGRAFAARRTPEHMRQAIELFEQAVAIDGTYGLAWSEIAVAYASSQLNGDARPLDVCPPAERAADQAIRAARAAPDLAEARFAMAYVQWSCQWDWPAAEAGLRDVVALDPRHARAALTLGHVLSQTGRHAEAKVFAALAREREPMDPMSHALSSQIAFQSREPEAALEHADQSVAIDQEFWIGHVMRAQALEQLQRIDDSLDVALSAGRSSGMKSMNSKPVSIRGYTLGKDGRIDEARQLLAALEDASRTSYVPPYAKALVNAGLRDGDAALELLERAYEVRDVHLMYLTVDPKWDFLREDARFEALLDRTGFR